MIQKESAIIMEGSRDDRLLNSRTKIGSFGVFALFAGMLSVIFSSCGNSSEVSIVAWVNDIPIEESEMQRVMNQNRSMVFNYFYEKYGVEDSSEFWNGTYGGEVPMDLLKKIAMDTLIKYKVERGLAYEEKLVQSLDYKSFLKEWEVENKHRENTISKGGVIFGPVAFSEDQYLQYSHSKLMIELKDAWAKTQQVDEELLLAHYEKTKEERYRKPDQFQIDVVTIPYRNDNRESLLLDMKTMMEEWKSGSDSLQTLSKLYHAYYEQHQYSRGDDSIEASFPGIWEAISKLKTGESSEIVDERSAWVWFHVKDRQTAGYEKFVMQKEAVRNHYIEEQFNSMIEEEIKQAEITLDQESYNELFV